LDFSIGCSRCRPIRASSQLDRRQGNLCWLSEIRMAVKQKKQYHFFCEAKNFGSVAAIVPRLLHCKTTE
jgi:hypothetical protein